MKAVRGSLMPFLSVSGVPLLGLGALVFCLWHPQASFRPGTMTGTVLTLQDPDPRLDKSMTVCLVAEARQVARCRETQPAGLPEAVAGYNLVARECTPAVFPATGLPPSVEP